METATAEATAPGLTETLLAPWGGLERFERGFDWRTHHPARAARLALADAESYAAQGRAAILEAGGDEEMVEAWTARFVASWRKYQEAGARTANWFITGPARFPVERNRKRMEIEQRRGDEMRALVAGAGGWARRQLRRAATAAAVQEAEAAGVEHEEKTVAGVRLVQNRTLDRVQLIFPGKPEPAMIQELKGRAFRWSPSQGAWQRQLTRNGYWAAEAILAKLEA